ncbi:uncharacterized protein LOC124363396 [Homalodisca vitripennis]|uniref:uncharacterized protein LOC124363396 n=1 Tax=Homalodisca vitripennis TaxID=197043 RepID=UPI001EEC66DA|nr:uncharacterized protein LOC124363396 [Homalodisca vitripennis]
MHVYCQRHLFKELLEVTEIVFLCRLICSRKRFHRQRQINVSTPNTSSLGAKLFAQSAGNITLLFTTTMETSPVHLLEKYQANYHMQLLLFKMCQLRIEAAWGKAICAVCRKHHAVVYYHHGDKSGTFTREKQLGAKLFAQSAGNITLLFTTTMETSPVHLLEKYQANYHMQLLLFKMCQLRIEAAWGKAICAVCRKHHAVVYYHDGDKSDETGVRWFMMVPRTLGLAQ